MEVTLAHFISDMVPFAFFFCFEYLFRIVLGEMVVGFVDSGEITEVSRLVSCLVSFFWLSQAKSEVCE